MTTLNSELLIEPEMFRSNISYIKNRINPSSNFMSVIKSDAYGHHLESIVKDIDDLSDGYGVVRADEAIKIRMLSKKKILLMQGVYNDKDYKLARENNFDIVVHNSDQFNLIKKYNNFENLWFKVNTGMNRLGFDIDEFLKIYNEYLINTKFTLMTHLASSNDPKAISNEKQFFSKVLQIFQYSSFCRFFIHIILEITKKLVFFI